MFEVKGKYSTAKIMINDVEDSCMSQIHHFVNHLAFTNPISIMPDTHAGKGSVIGFTMEMPEKLVPNVVGVDIGCGMLSINVGKCDISFEALDEKIRKAVPFGVNIHDNAVINLKNDFPWKRATSLAEKFFVAYRSKFGIMAIPIRYSMDWFLEKCNAIGGGARRIINSLGTLGGGNHFIETGVDDNGDNWITIHTGSRNFGKRICDYWQGKAVKFLRNDKRDQLQARIAEIKEEYKTETRMIKEKIAEAKKDLNLDVGIDMKGCEWLEDQSAVGYLIDMIFAQVYAEVNREYISRLIVDVLDVDVHDKIETVHNFIDFNDFIIRKGAIRSYAGERMIIPFNMRDGILLCEGKSNPEWNYSAPHGAGRVMSRAQAKKKLNVDEFKQQMDGIYSTSVNASTIDEAPGAYKDAKIIEDAIGPTADIISRIKPVHNMKDAGDFKGWKEMRKSRKKGNR